jgi:ATP-dependent RNA helicase DDX55/SPB4
MAPEIDKKKDPRAWDALTPPLAEWILDAIAAMGFGRMTPVQASTIPLVRTYLFAHHLELTIHGSGA